MKTLAQKLQAKKEERAAKITAMNALHEAAGESRSLTTEEQTQWDGLDQEERAIETEVKSLERQIELNAIETRQDFNHQTQSRENSDLAKFSITRAIRIAMGAEKRDGLEWEMHQEAEKEAREFGEAINGIGVPKIILSRDLSVTGDAGAKGANMVATQKVGFIDALLDKFVLDELGVSRMTGLTSNISIPKGGGFTAGFKGETEAATGAEGDVDDVELTAHRLPAIAKYSKRLLIQSAYGVDRYVTQGLEKAILRALQVAAINGPGGANSPLGILNTPGIGAVAMGANGLAITRSALVSLRKKVDVANALKGNLGYLSNALVAAALADTKVDAGSGKFILEDGTVVGEKFLTTNAVPSNLTKGTGTALSAAIFGNFADLLLAQFGGLDIVTDGVTLAEDGKVKVVINSFWDSVVTNPESFAAIVDAIAD